MRCTRLERGGRLSSQSFWAAVGAVPAVRPHREPPGSSSLCVTVPVLTSSWCVWLCRSPKAAAESERLNLRAIETLQPCIAQ